MNKMMFKSMRTASFAFKGIFLLLLTSFVLFSCDNNDSETPQINTDQANIQVVNTMFAAFGKGDVKGMQQTVSENTVWNYNGTSPIPYNGTYTGKEGIADFVSNIFSSVDVLSFKVNKMVAGDHNTVVALGEETQKIKSNGKMLTQSWVQVYTVENGLITRMEEYANTAVAAELFKN